MNERSLLEPGWTERSVQVNGVTIHLVEAGPQDGKPLILLHGFPEFWWGWRKQIGAFAEQGFRVIAPDMRGYGQSTGPSEVGGYAIERLVGDIAALADLLGHQRFSLVGHDWGGIVAWATAASHPVRVLRLVVMSAPHLDIFRNVLRSHPSQLLRSAYIGFFQLPLVPEAGLSAGDFFLLRRSLTATSRAGTFSADDIRAYVAEWRRPRRLRAMLHYYRALARRPRPPLGRIVPPTLILWGKRDHALLTELGEASLLQCAAGRFECHPAATHWLHLEEPQWVNQKISAFLKQV
jgi:pimeloyl-ACP methyl ester carboxylesterase